MRYGSRLALLAALAFAQPAIAQPAPPAPAGEDQPADAQPAPAARDEVGVPAKVWAVRIVGAWEADGAKGFSRVIGAFEGDQQRITVQWLASPDGRVVAAKTVDDEEAKKLTFGDFRAEPEDNGGVTMFVDTVPDNDGLRDTWVLIIGAPGEVRFGPATN